MAQELLQQEQTVQDSNHSEISPRTYTKTLVDTNEKFEELYTALESVDRFAYDTETNGTLGRFSVHIVGISFAILNAPYDHAWYIPFNHITGDNLSIDYLERLKPILESEKEKIAHHAKFDEMVLGRYGIDVKGLGHDTLVMAWLVNENKGVTRKLKPLVEQHLGVKMTTNEEVVDAVDRKRGEKADYNFAKVPLDAALDYAADDSYQCYALFNYFKEILEREKLWNAYRYIEGPFGRVTRKIEDRGAFVDRTALDNADERLPQIVEDVDAMIYKEAGEVFNIGSGQQLGKILFEKLGIGNNVPKTNTGNYKTDKPTLKMYTKYDIVQNVLRRKKIAKTHSTFVEGLKKNIARDGRVHTSFNGCGTVTGRLSSKSPNLQNIEGDEVEEVKVRNFYIPSDGFKFIVADYEQIEYRLMAHFSRDQYMLDAFASGKDFHEETARKAFNIAADEEVKHRQRFIAKSINFGIGYGRGPTSLAETLECTVKEAQDYIADYYKTFKQLGAFKQHVVRQARKQGYIRTLSGRKRRLLPGIRSDNWYIRGHSERQAFNTKIQGSAADIIKLAMIELDRQLPNCGGYMIIQVHDELVIEVPEDKAEESVGTIKHTMENPLNGKNPLRLPILVKPAIVDRWGDAK